MKRIPRWWQPQTDPRTYWAETLHTIKAVIMGAAVIISPWWVWFTIAVCLGAATGLLNMYGKHHQDEQAALDIPHPRKAGQ